MSEEKKQHTRKFLFITPKYWIIWSVLVLVELGIGFGLFWMFKQRFYVHSAFTAFFSVIGLWAFVIYTNILASDETYDMSDHGWNSRKPEIRSVMKTPLIVAASLATAIMLIALIASSPAFRAKAYYAKVDAMVTVIEDDDEISAFPNLLGTNNDTSNLPLIGQPEALKRAETEMGRFPALGSQFELVYDDLTSQSVNGSLTYVIPLQPKSWIKWNSEGNHGYFVIDRNNSSTEFVDESLHTTTKAPFASNAKRLIHSYMDSLGIPGLVTDISPEIDDEGVFHYVATVYEIDGLEGFNTVTGIIEVDGVTKDCRYYGLDEIPEYIDRVYPESFFEDYLAYYGKYKRGWWNSWTAQKEVQRATDGLDVIYIDGICYYYTGWCSTSGESSNGIMMMNSRTGEIEYHKTYGISESRAQGVMEGLVADKGYSASYPLLLQVAGTESYFSIMRDDSNNLVGYGFVSYKDYNKAAVSTTLLDAQAAYVSALARTNASSALDESLTAEASGIITAITDEVVDGNTFYYVKISGSSVIFQMRSNLDVNLVFAEEGDPIRVTYYDSGSSVETAISCEITPKAGTDR